MTVRVRFNASLEDKPHPHSGKMDCETSDRITSQCAENDNV